LQDRFGEGDAVQCGAGVFAGQAAQVDRRLAPLRLAVELHARHALQRFADVEVGNAAEVVGRDAVGDLDRRLFGADLVGIALAEAGHDDVALPLRLDVGIDRRLAIAAVRLRVGGRSGVEAGCVHHRRALRRRRTVRRSGRRRLPGVALRRSRKRQRRSQHERTHTDLQRLRNIVPTHRNPLLDRAASAASHRGKVTRSSVNVNNVVLQLVDFSLGSSLPGRLRSRAVGVRKSRRRA
jgi:hypothetical protein